MIGFENLTYVQLNEQVTLQNQDPVKSLCGIKIFSDRLESLNVKSKVTRGKIMKNFEMQCCEKCGTELAHLIGREELIQNACGNENCSNFCISQPERSKREDSQIESKCEMRCSEHCGNTVSPK